MFRRLLFLSTIAILSLTSCLNDECESTRTYNKWSPVYVTEEGLRPDITNEAPRDLTNPGKIYTYRHYLFINELRAGVHVIDNSDPAAPVPVSFIGIPGNVDISIKGDILYADMFRDLVSIDISDLNNAVLVDRQENVFESFIPFDNSEGKYIVEYQSTRESIIVDCGDDRWGQTWFRGGPDIFVDAEFDQLSNASRSPTAFSGAPSSFSSVGTGGSLARFTITKDHLYALDDSRINVFEIGSELPDKQSVVQVGWGIETIFPYKEFLFIGANNGMFIYDTEDPAQPRELSMFSHARACDPVFVDDNIAYVTLRGGGPCNNQTNQVDVLDVSNVTAPELLATFPMTNPHGLSVLNDVLYLCEGEQGLKVFDVTDPLALDKSLITLIDRHHSFDVIALSSGLLLVIGDDGLYQYDVRDPNDIEPLSMIAVIKS